MNTVLEFYQNMGLALSLLVLLTFFLAGAVKGVIGLGLPTIAMGMLGLAMAPAQAAALLIVPSTVTNLWQLAAGGHLRVLLRRLAGMLSMIFVGTLLGSAWLGIDSGPWAAHALGGALLVYALYGLVGPTVSVVPRREWWLGPLCGLATGVVTAATGVFVMPAVPYLQSLGLSRDEMVQALGLAFTVSTFALALGLAGQDALGGQALGASLLVLVPALLGMLGGQWLRQRISAPLFRRCFFIGLALLGGHLLVNG
ncbi:sulfite exporter TauE/SafE family protein [Pseudomonas guariconensis]|uniref:sulfite exporter TauE/SafE family protein n=1 Tax=Pseudomonas TaxID=286 RepID=UPI001CE46C48|nr:MULTISPECIES: sulfite exporter TauE/SafE family protein [Pseudomonas]MCO7642010.1 sulfite exporter TauE/SafE family protein [Pseudomonas sp. S 311-6]MCO7516811.1 sulfite exporter TauE/SafE family protein [Pseudomonas putida]MCO7567023.1 sulfite exporter TauE/SafE family protein [Pseudomonas mosselii]MCO7597105.1 sulfite exporter TauE/SafE family protein [Pseudomonas guariconensis]MCO7607214.1 sulfite exporter TauE/SafE family protein [Pseudomonas guariconensis]